MRHQKVKHLVSSITPTAVSKYFKEGDKVGHTYAYQAVSFLALLEISTVGHLDQQVATGRSHLYKFFAIFTFPLFSFLCVVSAASCAYNCALCKWFP